MVGQLKVVEFSPTLNEDAIKLVKDLLADLEQGEVVAVGLVIVRKDRCVASAYCASDRYHELMSGAARLTARLANDDGES